MKSAHGVHTSSNHVTPSEAVLLWPEVHPVWQRESIAQQATHQPVAHAQAMLTTAFLAIERSGGFSLEVQGEDGLSARVDNVVVSPRGDPRPWPTLSLEGQLHGAAHERELRVADLVYRWLGGKPSLRAWSATEPAHEALERSRENLIARGAMVETGRRWLIRPRFGPRDDLSYTFPIRVDILVRDCFTARKAVWDRLNKDVLDGLEQRVSSPG